MSRLVVGTWALASLGLPALMVCGCRQAPQKAAASPAAIASAAPASHSPVEVATKLGELYKRRDYEGVAALIEERHRAPTVNTLKAIDEVLSLNDQIAGLARDSFTGPLEDPWSLGFMRQYLGLFSSSTTFISQSFAGESVVVTFQQADKIPLSTARFVAGPDGAWRYCPDESGDRILESMLQLKPVLQKILVELRSGVTFDQYADAFHRRVIPCLRIATGRDATLASSELEDGRD
jgi:hypothetical protein